MTITKIAVHCSDDSMGGGGRGPLKMRNKKLKTPTPAQIRHARHTAALTQTDCAAMVWVALRTWQQWEQEGGERQSKMPIGLWELFLIKVKKGGDNGR